MQITKAEMETIINFTEADDTASIYTYNIALKNKLSRYAEKNPRICHLVESTPDGSCTYEIPKCRLSIMLTSPYSDKHREAVMNTLKNL